MAGHQSSRGRLPLYILLWQLDRLSVIGDVANWWICETTGSKEPYTLKLCHVTPSMVRKSTASAPTMRQCCPNVYRDGEAGHEGLESSIPISTHAYGHVYVNTAHCELVPAMASGTFKSPDEAIWAALRRDTPDPRARTCVPAWRFKLLSTTCSYLTRILVVPFYVPIWTVRYLLNPRPFPEWTYLRMLSNRIGRVDGRWNLGLLGPMDDSWVVPDTPAFYKDAVAKGEIQVDFARLESVSDEMRVGVAVHPAVKGDVRAGVMLTPNKARGRGLELAKQDEQVICHVHGG